MIVSTLFSPSNVKIFNDLFIKRAATTAAHPGAATSNQNNQYFNPCMWGLINLLRHQNFSMAGPQNTSSWGLHIHYGRRCVKWVLVGPFEFSCYIIFSHPIFLFNFKWESQPLYPRPHLLFSTLILLKKNLHFLKQGLAKGRVSTRPRMWLVSGPN